ncbi:MAG: (d)CMP kinase [Chloroflexota bacterium]|nr:(d)CMP kinase [Dehalococcoidia bacterium]MDW8253861.1 (d)CMP kinase [Chloroflexota bacterium]
MKALTIAIDGPSGAGKSALAEALARRLGYRYLDTGVWYRAVALAALRAGIAVDDTAALTALAQRLDIRIEPTGPADGRQYTALLNGEDVTWAIRERPVEQIVSEVAAVPGVRTAVVAQQQRQAGAGGAILAGRDIGTVVLPNADLKIYLNASPEVRARRRLEQLRARGVAADYDTVLADIYHRDQIDSSREMSPLRRAPDAIEVRNDEVSLDELVDQVFQLVEERRRHVCSAR